MPHLGGSVTYARERRMVIAATLLLFIGGAAQLAYSKDRTAPRPGCSLLTPAQIQAVLGKPFDQPKEIELSPPFGTTPGSHCTYRSQGSGDYVLDFFVYVVTPADAKKWFDMGAAAAKRRKDATGIGDAAYTIPDHSEIHVVKRNVVYWIVTEHVSEKQMMDLASSVAARI